MKCLLNKTFVSFKVPLFPLVIFLSCDFLTSVSILVWMFLLTVDNVALRLLKRVKHLIYCMF